MRHTDGIDDAQVPVQLRQHPVAADPEPVHRHDGFPVPDQAELHESASARLRRCPDGFGRPVELEGVLPVREDKGGKAVLVVRAFMEYAAVRMVPVDVFVGKAEADGMLEGRPAAPGDRPVRLRGPLSADVVHLRILREDHIDRSGVIHPGMIPRKDLLRGHRGRVDPVRDHRMMSPV